MQIGSAVPGKICRPQQKFRNYRLITLRKFLLFTILLRNISEIFLHSSTVHGGLFKTVMYNFRSNPLIQKELSEND